MGRAAVTSAHPMPSMCEKVEGVVFGVASTAVSTPLFAFLLEMTHICTACNTAKPIYALHQVLTV